MAATSPARAAGQYVSPPEFNPPHTMPAVQAPAARGDVWQAVDVALLVAAIALGAWLVLGRRSRRGMMLLMLASLAYFGFVRHGCVCAIGAIQNAALALGDSSYVMPLVVLGFLLIPLAATLVVGRVFCGAACPLGAIQDLVLVKPLRVPAWLEHALGLGGWLYLGLAVLLAATGAGFIICQYDPFVGFFRFDGPATMLALGAVLLALGMFIGRPYCRFICPLGAVFRPLSSVAWRHVSVAPEQCIRCRLCEDACPFGAIQIPSPNQSPRRAGKLLLTLALVALPLLIAGGAVLGRLAGPTLARLHPDDRLARQLYLESIGQATPVNESTAYRNHNAGESPAYAAAGRARTQMNTGAAWLGGFMGLVIGLKLVRLSVRRRQLDFLANRATCLSCGRCFNACPMHRRKLRRIGQPAPGGGA